MEVETSCFGVLWWPPCPLLTWEVLSATVSWGLEVVMDPVSGLCCCATASVNKLLIEVSRAHLFLKTLMAWVEESMKAL